LPKPVARLVHFSGMSRYYFHREGAEDSSDPAGAELPDDGAVREWAKREALILGIEQIRQQGRLVLGSKVTVTDEQGEEVTHACVGDAIQVIE
jgi:transcription elongation GreA/GreB family factor